MKVKTNLLSYKDPDTGVYTPIPIVVSGDNEEIKKEINELNEKLNQEISDRGNAILDVKAECGQTVPAIPEGSTVEECLAWLEENGDVNKPYVLPDGFIYVAKSMGVQSLFTNLAETKNEHWKNNIRVNSSGEETTTTEGLVTTNYFEATKGDVLRVKGLNLFADTTNYERVLAYKGIGTYSGQITPSSYANAFVVDENGITTYTLFLNNEGGQLTSSTVTDTTHLRLCGVLTGTAEDVIITINEEIVYSEGDTSKQWVNSGKEFGTATLEVVPSVEEMTDEFKKYINEETGTIWAYGKYVNEENLPALPNYTNLAEPLSDNTTDTSKWVNGYRLSSSGLSAQAGKTVTNPIVIKSGDVVRVKGVDFEDSVDRIGLWMKTTSGTEGTDLQYVSALPTAGIGYAKVNDIHEFTLLHQNYTEVTVRFAFTTPTDVSQVIITVNEPIELSSGTKPSYTNQIPLSTNQDGTPYNGGLGYKDEYRYNSSFAEKENTGSFITGYIPVKEGDVIHFSEGIFSGENGGINSSFCNSSFELKISLTPYRFVNNDSITYFEPYDYDSENKVLHSLTVPSGYGITCVKFSLVGSGEGAVITVNEEIVDTSSPTGYTNFATSFESDARLNSSGGTTSETGATTCVDYIPVTTGDIIRIKGFGALDDYVLVTYTSSKVVISASEPATTTDGFSYSYNSSTGIATIIISKDTIKFIRVSGKLEGSTSDVIITKNEEITDLSGGNYKEGWHDTYITPYSLDTEVLEQLNKRIFANTEYISALSDRITELEENGVKTETVTEPTTSIPDYWKTAVDNMLTTIEAQLDEGGVDALGFVWGADVHGKNGYTNPSNGAGTSVTKNIGYVSQYAIDKFNLDFAIFSGDIMSQAAHSAEVTVHQEHEAMWEIFSPIDINKLLLEKGNHDGAYGAAVNGVYYLYNIGAKKVYNNLFRKQATDRTRVFGGDGSYFYVDTPHFRVIMLNGHTDGDGSFDSNGYAVYNSMKNGVYGTEQLTWLANEALNTDKKIILSAHQPFSASKDGSVLAGLLNAYNNRESYNKSVSVTSDTWGSGLTSDYNTSSVSANFANAKGKVVAYFHGHIHYDTIDGTTNTFVVASITTAGADVRDTNPPLRTPNTATETALDIVVITPNKIYFNRLGAGENREVTINEKPIEELLMDFTYTTNDDGTYTITGWKGTYNGVTSTECILPDSNKVSIDGGISVDTGAEVKPEPEPSEPSEPSEPDEPDEPV